MRDTCPKCEKPAAHFSLQNGDWICLHCADNNDPSCRLFEYGHENSIDAKGSTAHVRDIKDRRYNAKENRTFNYSKELGKTYFFPKG